MNRIIFFFLFFSAIGLQGAGARADECAVTREAIFKMSRPEYASNAIWDAIYGKTDAQERFIGAVMLESGRSLAVGERFGGGAEDAAVVVAQIDSYGRVVQEKAHAVKGLRGLNKLVRTPQGFILLGRSRAGKSSAESWLGFFDLEGKMLRTKTIRGGKFAIEAEDIVPLQQEKGFLIAVSEQERSGARHAALFKLNGNGDTVLQRAFNPGPDNTVLSLSAAGKDHYLGAGYIRGEDGRKTGWLVMFNRNAEIVWERQYPRGRESVLNGATDYGRDYTLVIGESVPAGGGNRAGWVMMINRSNGEIVWQRYFTGYLDYMARDILVSEKNVISVLFDSRVPEKRDDEETPLDPMAKPVQPAIRVLTLNARGTVLQNDEFTNGEGTHAYRMIAGPNENRMIVGSTAMTYIIKKDPPKPVPVEDEKAGPIISPVKSMEKPAEKPEEQLAPEEEEAPAMARSMDGWMIAALPALPYKDPCVKK